MPNNLVDIKGFDQLQVQLKRLPDKLKIKEVQKVLVRATPPMISTLKGKMASHVRKGSLLKSVGWKKGTTAPVVTVGFAKAVSYVDKSGRSRRAQPSHAHWFEYGTNQRVTGSKNRKLSAKKRLNSGGSSRGKMQASNVVRDSFNATKSTAISQSASQIAKYLQKQIDRLSK